MRKARKIELHKETLRRLDSEGLRDAKGGTLEPTRCGCDSVACSGVNTCTSFLVPCQAD